MSAARGRGAYLALGSAIASFFNFYAFLLLPAAAGTVALETFVRDNYLGGAYLFGIGSSVAPLAVYILSLGRRAAMMRYLAIAIGVLAVVGVAGFGLARPPWTYLCLAGAVAMHAAGFFLAALIQEERLALAAALQVVQPLLFAAFVTLAATGLVPVERWAPLYLVSAVACLAAFAGATRWHGLRARLAVAPEVATGWRAVIERTVLCVSFPLFFQLELILCGTATAIDLGVYTMLQKLYSSVSISLFGSIGVLLVVRGLGHGGAPVRMFTREWQWMALAAAVTVALVGTVVAYAGRSVTLSPSLVAAAAVLGALFTLCSFAGLAYSVSRPFLGLRTFGVSLGIYALAFFALRPATTGGMLAIAAVFFVAYLGLAALSPNVAGRVPERQAVS